MKTLYTDSLRAIPDTVRQPSEDIYSCVLQVDTEKTVTVPERATIAIFTSQDNFYVNSNGVVVKPVASDFTKNTGSELSPTVYDVSNVTELSLLSPVADNSIGISFYGGNYDELTEKVQQCFNESAEIYKHSDGKWYSPDIIGDQLREVHKGGYLQSDGTTVLTFSDLAGITITSFNGTTTPTKVGNTITTTIGTIEYLELSNGSKYNFEDQSGSTARDEIAVLNAELSGTVSWQESIEIESSRNLNGYNKVGDVYIPRLETAENISKPISQQVDVLGNTLEFYGKSRYDLGIVQNSVGVFNGIDNYIDLPIDIEEDFYICFYGKFLTTSSYYGKLLSRGVVGQPGEITVERIASSSFMNINIYPNNGIRQTFTHSVDLFDDLPHVLEIRLTGDLLSMYIDGIKETNQLSSIPIFSTTEVVTICANSQSKSENISSIMQEFILKNKYSKGVFYVFSEGNSNIVYDKSLNLNNGTWQGDTANIHGFSDLARPNNLLDGFDLWIKDSDGSLLKVPFDVNGNSIKTQGDLITGFTWDSRRLGSNVSHNGAESKMIQPESPELYSIDSQFVNSKWFNSGVPQYVGYNDLYSNYETKGIWLNDVSSVAKSDWIAKK